MINKDSFVIAQIGKTVGLKGNLKFYIYTDFIEQFKVNNFLHTDSLKLKIKSIDLTNEIINFYDYDNIYSSKELINVKFYSSEEETKKEHTLEDNQYFWFDIKNCKILDENSNEPLGTVSDIQRIGDVDYLHINTDIFFVNQKYPKLFLIPYINRYIKDINIKLKEIKTIDAIHLLESS